MKNIFLALVLVIFLFGCGGGGGGASSSACSALNVAKSAFSKRMSKEELVDLLVSAMEGERDLKPKANLQQSKVFNGEECTQLQRPSVVPLLAFTTITGEVDILGICTASFITINDLVTSAHCFAGVVEDFPDVPVAWGIVVAEDEAYVAVDYRIHPLYSGLAGSPYDIAVFSLNEVPYPHISPIPILFSDPLTIGEEIIAYGYGMNEEHTLGKLAAVKMTVAEIQGGNFAALITDDGASICSGDSGGPVVQVKNGVTSLVGINSFGLAGSCRTSASPISGFLDLQRLDIISFIQGFSPDITVR